MAVQWFIRHNGKVHGPFSSSQLQAAASSGKLRPEFLVSNDQQRWVKASDVVGLRLSAGPTPLKPGTSTLPPKRSTNREPAGIPAAPPPLPVDFECPASR